MSVTSKTATAVIALMIAGGAYPLAAVAQSATGTTTEQVEVNVIPADEGAADAEQGLSETGEAIGQATENAADTVQQGLGEAGEAIGQAADTAGQAIEAGAEATVEAVDQGAEAVDQAIDTEAEVGTETTAGTMTGTTGETMTGATTDTTIEAQVIEGDADTAGALAAEQELELEQAAAEGKPVPPAEMIIGVQQDGQWLSSDLVDEQVRTPEGEVIGDIGAVLFSEQGPEAVVVEVGGFLGIGEKEVAIRWDELTMTPDGIFLEATEDQLKNAPEFVSLDEARTNAEVELEQDQGGMLTSEPAVVGQPLPEQTTQPMAEPAETMAQPMAEPQAEVEGEAKQ